MTENAATWLTVPDLVEELGLGVGQIHRLLEDRALLAVRRDGVLVVPADFIVDGAPVVGLAGTITLLADSGFSDEETMRWLLSEEESLGRAPIAALREGQKAPVRRAAQSLAF